MDWIIIAGFVKLWKALMAPDPPPLIVNVTLSFEDFAKQNPCNVQTSGLTPCIRKCEQHCKATFKFDDPNCKNGLSTVVWHGTCLENFKNGKLRKKFPMKGCTDYEVYWGTHPLPGWAYDRDLVLKKKGKNKEKGGGDQCGFTVTGCHRNLARLNTESKECKASKGSCEGKVKKCCRADAKWKGNC